MAFCPRCDDSRVCDMCEGGGTVENPHARGTQMKCVHCGGDGVCMYCKPGGPYRRRG